MPHLRRLLAAPLDAQRARRARRRPRAPRRGAVRGDPRRGRSLQRPRTRHPRAARGRRGAARRGRERRRATPEGDGRRRGRRARGSPRRDPLRHHRGGSREGLLRRAITERALRTRARFRRSRGPLVRRVGQRELRRERHDAEPRRGGAALDLRTRDDGHRGVRRAPRAHGQHRVAQRRGRRARRPRRGDGPWRRGALRRVRVRADGRGGASGHGGGVQLGLRELPGARGLDARAATARRGHRGARERPRHAGRAGALRPLRLALHARRDGLARNPRVCAQLRVRDERSFFEAPRGRRAAHGRRADQRLRRRVPLRERVRRGCSRTLRPGRALRAPGARGQPHLRQPHARPPRRGGRLTIGRRARPLRSRRGMARGRARGLRARLRRGCSVDRSASAEGARADRAAGNSVTEHDRTRHDAASRRRRSWCPPPRRRVPRGAQRP